MKAVRMMAPGRPLELHDVPIPSIGTKDILVHVRAAGICHSDAHYRAGRSPMGKLPLTLGHEVAGVVDQIGSEVENIKVSERVCLHYNISCGNCSYCISGHEQFCEKARMLGHHVDGGYAEYIAVPARNAIPLPDEIPFEQGATLMCASATAFHALKKARLQAGESVAVFGIGGLGLSAIQLAKALGAMQVFAVDIKEDKLKLASEYGAIPINANRFDPVDVIHQQTNGKGVNVALELIGMPKTMQQTVETLGVMGRAIIVGISQQPLKVEPYRTLIGHEAEIIGSNDHLLQELPLLVEMTRRKILDTSRVVSHTVPLDSEEINQRLDDLENFTNDVRVVIVP